jgi:hypothetical protein
MTISINHVTDTLTSTSGAIGIPGAGNMSYYTANGAGVPVGNWFLLTSSAAMPSGFSAPGGSTVVVPTGQIWVGLFSAMESASVFSGGLINCSTANSTLRYLFSNSGTNTINTNVLGYLPIMLFRIK